MDPNAEDTSRKPVDVVQVEVEGTNNQDETIPAPTPDFGLRERPISHQPIQPPLSSSIFRALNTNTNTSGPSSNVNGTGADEQPEFDNERIQQIHEEEFQRRLRGEYEQAQRRVGEVVSNNMERPLRLTSIRVSPQPPTTRSSFLSSLISPFLSPSSSYLHSAPPAPENLHQVLLTTRALMGHLDKFGIFDMNLAKIRFEPRRGGDMDEVEMILSLREKGRLFLKAGTEVGGGEGGGNVTARIRNVFGGAETLEINASIGTKTKSAYQATLSTPILASPLLNFALSAFELDRDNSAFASHRERTQGARAKLSAILPWGTHDLQYELVNREIGHLTPTASVSIRELAVPSTKSSLSHTWTSDTRDDPWTGTAGRLLKLTHEYAGLPGSSERAHFFKSTSQSQLSRALYPGSSINYSISSLTTCLFPLHASGQSTYLSDRTYLGGPNSIRGWKVGGLGRRDGPDSLGGDLSWAMGLSIFAPIPKKEHWPLKLHGFVNAGKVVGYDQGRSFTSNMTKLYTSPNLSIGLGLVYRLEPLRVEVNFSMPLVGRKGERTARGFGVGVGIEFL